MTRGHARADVRRPGAGEDARLRVHLDNFSGPFDVLLGLIAKHKARHHRGRARA